MNQLLQLTILKLITYICDKIGVLPQPILIIMADHYQLVLFLQGIYLRDNGTEDM